MTHEIRCCSCMRYKNPGAFDGSLHNGRPVCRACREMVRQYEEKERMQNEAIRMPQPSPTHE